jgi:hypothetical protein
LICSCGVGPSPAYACSLPIISSCQPLPIIQYMPSCHFFHLISFHFVLSVSAFYLFP